VPPTERSETRIDVTEILGTLHDLYGFLEPESEEKLLIVSETAYCSKIG